jgi:hypothetical protein
MYTSVYMLIFFQKKHWVQVQQNGLLFQERALRSDTDTLKGEKYYAKICALGTATLMC